MEAPKPVLAVWVSTFRLYSDSIDSTSTASVLESSTGLSNSFPLADWAGFHLPFQNMLKLREMETYLFAWASGELLEGCMLPRCEPGSLAVLISIQKMHSLPR